MPAVHWVAAALWYARVNSGIDPHKTCCEEPLHSIHICTFTMIALMLTTGPCSAVLLSVYTLPVGRRSRDGGWRRLCRQLP